MNIETIINIQNTYIYIYIYRVCYMAERLQYIHYTKAYKDKCRNKGS